MNHSEVQPALRIWMFPFLLVASISGAVFLLTYVADALGSDDPRHVLSLIVHPNPEAAASTLANAGEIMAAVLAIALTVVALLVELASNRYTHRVTELFVGEPINFAVLGLFVVAALQGVWVSVTFDGNGGFVPYYGIVTTMGLLTLCLLLLLPYFYYVFNYLNPLQIVQRIRAHAHAVITDGASDVTGAQLEVVRGVEQLADVALGAMEHRDKAVSVASLDALRRLVSDYQELRPGLPARWYVVGERLAANPDFLSMDPHSLERLQTRQVWLEMKVLRQYQMIYGEALNRMRDLNYVVAINTRLLAEEAVRRQNLHLLHLLMKFFNTYVRAAINARDVRTAYNVFNQYRRLAEALIEARREQSLVEVVRYFKYYGLASYNARLPFILETVAYDICEILERSSELQLTVVDQLLKIFLQMDKDSRGDVQEASLRGVRKAQIKLATYFLAHGDVGRARAIYRDMRDEDSSRLASIRAELLAVRSPEYWEITDRGGNFDYIPPARKGTLSEFFAWFPDLPQGRVDASIQPVAPGADLDDEL